MAKKSNFSFYGTFTADGNTSEVVVSGWVTLSAHYDSGSGTITWQFKGPDGVWRGIYSGAGGTTAQVFTATHMVNAFFADDVRVRGVLSSSSTPQIDWQVFSNPNNRR
jgi:hypothetical protein